MKRQGGDRIRVAFRVRDTLINSVPISGDAGHDGAGRPLINSVPSSPSSPSSRSTGPQGLSAGHRGRGVYPHLGYPKKTVENRGLASQAPVFPGVLQLGWYSVFLPDLDARRGLTEHSRSTLGALIAR